MMTSKLGEIGILLVITLVLIGCDNQGRSKGYDTNDSKGRLLTDADAIEVVRKESGEPPSSVLIGSNRGKTVIAAVFAKKGSPFISGLQVLEEAGHEWITTFTEEPHGCFFIEWQWEEIAGSPFLYYVTDEAGNQTGIAYFSLVSLDDGRKYEISIEGETRNYSHIREIGDRLKRNSELLTFLKYKIASSDIVYHPQPEDFDLNLPQNASKRWALDNDVGKSEMYSSDGQPHSLQLHWYKGNLLDQVDCSSNGMAESDRYVVLALFKSDLVCFDKKRGKSCVLLPRWPYRGFENVRFINANEVVVQDFDEKVEFIVNLSEATVRKAMP
jgi:hypothetical protein